MSPEMGPADSDSSQWWPMEWLGSRSVAAMVKFVDLYSKYTDGDVRLNIDLDRCEISLHGESEQTGDPFSRGYLLGLLEGLTALTAVYLGLMMLGSGVGTPVVAVTAIISLFFFAAAFASVLSLANFTVVDLTTEKRPAELDELAKQYVDGEIDEQELEQRSEQVVARD